MDLQATLLSARRRLLKNVRRYIYGRPPDRVRQYLQAARPIDLVVHVGAHLGQERSTYRALGVRRVVWIEGDPDTFRRLCENLRADEIDGAPPVEHHPICALMSDTDDKTVAFHRFSNDGASSSIYKPTARLRQEWPGLDVTGEPLELVTRRLETILDELDIAWPPSAMALLVVDVQGHEAGVLAGVGRYAEKFDLCQCEISKEAVYEGGALYADLKGVLARMGYALASHAEAELPWHGDVVFRRRGTAPIDRIHEA
jgi:FkbM family methyltransferase